MSQQVAQIKKQEIRARWEKNPNVKPRLDKVVINLSVGQAGETLQKAAQVLLEMCGQKPSLVGEEVDQGVQHPARREDRRGGDHAR